MLPTAPRWASRSMKNSATAPSSRRATFVSWGVLLTMRSLFMEASFHEPPFQPLPARGAPREIGGSIDGRRVKRGNARKALVGEAAHPHIEDEADGEKR